MQRLFLFRHRKFTQSVAEEKTIPRLNHIAKNWHSRYNFYHCKTSWKETITLRWKKKDSWAVHWVLCRLFKHFTSVVDYTSKDLPCTVVVAVVHINCMTLMLLLLCRSSVSLHRGQYDTILVLPYLHILLQSHFPSLLQSSPLKRKIYSHSDGHTR